MLELNKPMYVTSKGLVELEKELNYLRDDKRLPLIVEGGQDHEANIGKRFDV